MASGAGSILNAHTSAAGREVVPLLTPGEVGGIIVRSIKVRDIDMTVMGAYAHSLLRSLLFGCMTNPMSGSSKIPILLMR